MFKKAGVSFNPLALKLLNKLLKAEKKTGEKTNRSAYLCRLVIEEAKRQGIFNG